MCAMYRQTDVPPSSEWSSLDTPLGAQVLGDEGLRRLVFLHGFTQTSYSWMPIAEHFVDRGFQCVVVDLPGHGASSHVRANLTDTAPLLAATCGRASYIGYSLGGRTALHLAVAQPSLVGQLVLIGANPGLSDPTERRQRLEADHALADGLERDGLHAFLERWVTQPLFGDLQLTERQLADRMRNTVDGLAASLRLAGTGAQESLWPSLPSLTMPVLAMAGALDTKFAALAIRIAGDVPDGSYHLVPEAAHACHLQAPQMVAQVIEEFLDRS